MLEARERWWGVTTESVRVRRSKVALVVGLALGFGAIIGLFVGRLLSLLALVGLDVLQVDQSTRGSLAGEEGLALRVLAGLGTGLVTGLAVGLVGIGGVVSVVGPRALVGRERLMARLVVGIGLATVVGVIGGLVIALVGSLMGAGAAVNASGLGGLGVGLGVGLLVGFTGLAALVHSGGLAGPNPDRYTTVPLSAGWGSGLALGVVMGLVMGLVGLQGLGGLTAGFVALVTLAGAVILVVLGALVGAWWASGRRGVS